MKKLFLLLTLTLFFAVYVFAQTVPRGMKYQAVARDLKGEILANANIDLRINLLSKKDGSSVNHYSEVHSITTNQLGLFSLVVGEGKIETGDYEKIPWSTADIWMEIQIKTKGEETFATISNSQLMAVPYAYYAATAGVLVGTKLKETPKDSVVEQTSAVVGRELPEAPKCDCDGGLSEVKMLYLGPSAVTINVYKNASCTPQHLVASFTNVNNGATLTITANANFPGNKLPDDTYLKIMGPTIDVVALPAKCDDPIVGETFGNFSVLSRKDKKNGTECTVCDIRKDWMIGGNGVFDMCNWLGTKTNTDLVLITNNIERLRILANGDVDVKRNLHVGLALTVDGITNLNNRLGVSGITSLNNSTQSFTPANGALVVAGGTGIAQNLNVGGNLNVMGTSSVGGAVSFGGVVHITDFTQSTNTTNGALIVDGGVGIGKNVNIGGTLTSTGAATINNTLTLATDNSNFVASFQNSNNGDGDGIQIKLGKNHPAYNGGNGYLNVTSPGTEIFQGAINTVKGWVIDHNGFDPAQLLTFIPAAYLAGTVCNLTNLVTDKINHALDLPYKIGPYGTPPYPASGNLFSWGGFSLPDPLPNIPGFSIPGIPALNVLPRITVMPEIPQINCSVFPSFSVPNINFTNVSNSLTNNNQFMSFVDKDNRELGSIRAQSVTDWEFNYLDGTYFVNLMAGMVGIDVANGLANTISGFTNIAKSYNSIGVEYASGHGDYAEWLERVNPAELISAGDIVGVKGGKISKDLAGAEQILAVSHNPIVLGNVQTKEKEPYGNKIAFTGQVPVKVIGPVNMGDYIIAKSDVSGYGIAVTPANVSTNDLKLAVGRSWETNLNEGPKMVNTLIGVDNGDYIKIMKESQDKIEALETRMKMMEDKMNKILNQSIKKKTKK